MDVSSSVCLDMHIFNNRTLLNGIMNYNRALRQLVLTDGQSVLQMKAVVRFPILSDITHQKHNAKIAIHAQSDIVRLH